MDTHQATTVITCKACLKPVTDCGCSDDTPILLPAPEPDAFIGRVIGGYRVLELIGRGGMASVYKVQHERLHTFMALKLITSTNAITPAEIRRFDREAKTLSQIQHENLVPIVDYGTTDEGYPFMLIGYCEGKSLAQLIKERSKIDERFAIKIFTQICHALVYAHGKRIVHRDLKPSNIMIGGDDETPQVKVLDFGIAKALEGDSDQNRLTQTGEVLGSPSYMSPEQCQGNALDERSDIYSFGCLMYEAVCGHPPFEAPNPMQMLFKHIQERPPLLPEGCAGESLTRVIYQTLEKDPAHRYQSAEDLLQDLNRLDAGLNPVNEVGDRKRRNFQRLCWARNAIFLVLALLYARELLHYFVKPAYQEQFDQGRQLLSEGGENLPLAEATLKKALSTAQHDRATAQTIQLIQLSLASAYGKNGETQKQLDTLQLATTIGAPDSKATGTAYQNLAEAQIWSGQYNAALKTGQKALSILEARTTRFGKPTLETLSLLCTASLGCGKLDDAQKYAQQQLERARVAAHGTPDLAVASAEENLTRIAAARHDRSTFEKHSKACIEIREKLLGTDSPLVVKTREQFERSLKN